jgi:cell division protein FtsB
MRTQEAEAQNLEYLKSINSTSYGRDELLKDFDSEQNRPKDISIKTLLWVYIVVFLALGVLLPKVYISNQIYYSSKEVNRMYHKYTALKEEQDFLKRELEKLRYQTLVIDGVD